MLNICNVYIQNIYSLLLSGLYLSDLIYIDVAHPHSGGLESEPRSLKMNNILRTISKYQESSFEHLPYLEHIQNYLMSKRYIEELQKFEEDDNYKLSLKLEPPAQILSQGTPQSKRETQQLISCSGSSKFARCHRRTKSLNANFKSNINRRNSEKRGRLQSKGEQSTIQDKCNLIDDSKLTESLSGSSEVPLSGFESEDNIKGIVNAKVIDAEEQCQPKRYCIPQQSSEEMNSNLRQRLTCEGCLKRKQLLKGGKKPKVSAWKSYWVSLLGTSLMYYPSKPFRGNDRQSFKKNPSKMTSIVDWMVVMGDDPLQPDAFQLVDHDNGNVYKFRCGTQSEALKWCQNLTEASQTLSKNLSTNLISFD